MNQPARQNYDTQDSGEGPAKPKPEAKGQAKAKAKGKAKANTKGQGQNKGAAGGAEARYCGGWFQWPESLPVVSL